MLERRDNDRFFSSRSSPSSLPPTHPSQPTNPSNHQPPGDQRHRHGGHQAALPHRRVRRQFLPFFPPRFVPPTYTHIARSLVRACRLPSPSQHPTPQTPPINHTTNTQNTNQPNHATTTPTTITNSCDGAEANRTYFRDIAMGVPQDSVVLTLGCGQCALALLACLRSCRLSCVCACACITYAHTYTPLDNITKHTKNARRQVPVQQEGEGARHHRRRPAPPHGAW